MKAIRERIPDHAKDLRLNLDALAKIESLTPRQLWGAALASALAARNDELVRAVAEEARLHLDEPAFAAARTAAALMGMNNVYYRATHLISNPEYGQLPARLRMQGLASPGLQTNEARLEFELWCLAASAVNGCGKCLDSHEQELRKRGATALQTQDAVRIAAILHAVAAVLDGERALAPADDQARTHRDLP